MTSSEVPADIRRFLLHAVPSVPHLEALLLMRRSDQESWSIDRLAAQLFLPPTRVSAIVEDLERLGFAAPSTPGAWVFQPQSEAIRHAVDRVDEYYRVNVVRVSRLLHANLERHAFDFSEVFRLRKDK